MPRYRGHNFKPGDRVRLRASFLRSTGQYTGADAHSVWTVVAVDGDLISVDEPKQYDAYEGMWTPEEWESMKVEWRGRRFVPRRFHAANLHRAGEPDVSGL